VPRSDPARVAAAHEPATIAATARDTGMPVPHVDPPEPTDAQPTGAEAADSGAMTRPVIPVTQHDAPEQLTLAEKLGLRAPGEKPDPTGEQNVGPTR
jgi:cell division transport system ATP-binding protein